MSHQGNITILSENEHEHVSIFTTHRWSGNATARIVQDFLKQGDIDSLDSDDCICFISHHDQIRRPISEIGNADTPTVIIDFTNRCVIWTIDSVNKAKWTFKEYRDLNLNTLKLFQDYFVP